MLLAASSSPPRGPLSCPQDSAAGRHARGVRLVSLDVVPPKSAAACLDAAAPAGPGRTQQGRDPHHPRHRRRVRRCQPAARPKRNDLARQGRRQPVLRAVHPDARQLRLRRPRLGAETSDFAASSSSINKGETFIDTAKNIEAMGIDVVVVRHSVPGARTCCRATSACSVINAGDGAHEHPTQGLLDIFTIRQDKGRDRGADGRPGRRHRPQPGRPQQHPRPDEAGGEGDRLRPADAGAAGDRPSWASRSPTTSTTSCRECDVVNLLRIQFERQRSGLFPSIREYVRLFGMTRQRLARGQAGHAAAGPRPDQPRRRDDARGGRRAATRRSCSR